jgi:hypothetical protein
VPCGLGGRQSFGIHHGQADIARSKAEAELTRAKRALEEARTEALKLKAQLSKQVHGSTKRICELEVSGA